MGYIVGVDIGGTFTDAAAVSTDDGSVYTSKARSTPDDLSEGLVEALRLLASEAGITLEELLQDTIKFGHGTTQTSNVLFTWVGARTGLITTRGFADELLMMRARGRVAGLSLAERRHLSQTEKPPQIVPRDRIFEVSERIDHSGRVLVPLDQDEVRQACSALIDDGVESIAVSLLWSPQYPDHELRVREIVREYDEDIHVSLSHELAPVVGEYERTTTAVANAFVTPTVAEYFERVESTLRELGLTVPVLILQASGGVAQVSETVPVNTVESGPAAGMVAVRAMARTSGFDKVIATDVGGTTFKVGILTDGNWDVARETVINQYSLILPIVDLVSIGSGGGSIAWTDSGRLRVGPKSAGSDPGPACYGWGGIEPTVTDADLVLGFLNPERFLGGRLRLDVDRAREAIAGGIADELFDGDVIAAATGIRRIVDSQMADLLRKTTIERGYDPREFSLMAYGGAGPLHAAGYASGLGVDTIIVPRGATAYSAYGAAASDIHHSLQRSVRQVEPEEGLLSELYNELDREGMELLRRQDVREDDMVLRHWADMRYERQLHDLRVNLGEDEDRSEVRKKLEKAFKAQYEQLYGSGAVLEDAPIQVLRVGTEAIGEIRKPQAETYELMGSDPAEAQTGERDVYWPEAGSWMSTPIFGGPRLDPGNRCDGPAVIEHPGTTIVVPESATAEIDRYLNTVITFEKDTSR